jgi:class 3 adenylate cyclase
MLGSLERGGNNKDIIFKNLQGSSVSCIFMFCDVRGFTDATECLQEEIFAFTNRIAAVVHSYCHTYGGAASQNAGDAFLITWKLDAPDVTSSKHMSKSIGMTRRFSTNIAPGQNAFKSSLYSSKQQADKALLSCVKICMALQVDDFFLATLSSHASKKIREKVESKRSGPIVQMGFGLHAGRAVQGAIGSQMKLDPTYIGSNVNFAEFLESSSKDYGVPVVMSHLFVQLLKPMLRVKCRKIDRICFDDEALEDILADLPDTEEKDVIDLYTLDFDIPSLLQSKSIGQGGTTSLFLPSGPSIYRESIWRSQEFRSLFQRFHGDFFQRYNDGLNAYYARDWDHAQECFESLRNEFNDGPSQHFLDLMKELGKPPKNFASYRVVS